MTQAASVLCAIVFFVLAAQPAPAAGSETRTLAPVSIAVLDLELVDTSLEGASHGVDPAETKRLVLVSDLLRDLLGASGKYQVVDTTPAKAAIADAGLIHGCNGCDVKIAGSLGADRVMTGTVEKVSTLILTISLFERDVASGALLQVATAQIRGNTDESWTRGVRWLVRNRLLAEPKGEK
ncbi:MAG: DUF3280 domain-containing protein [Rhodomicrobiaceae bacterium]